MLLNNYAVVLRELGRLSEAASSAERAYSKAKKAGSQVVTYYSLGNRTLIYLEQHDYARAALSLNELEAIIKARFASNGRRLAILASLRSLLAAGRGNYDSAVTLADNAISLLEAIPKDQGDLFPIVLIRRSSIALGAGWNKRAAEDAARALNLIQSTAPSGVLSAYSGRAYLNLGLALRAQNRPDEARDAFRKASENFQATLGSTHPDSRRARQLAGLQPTL